MSDHIGLRTTGFDRLKLFYQTALQPLSLSVRAEYPSGAGFGRAQSRADVDAFYAAAMSACAVDKCAPELRPHYHPDHHGAFVLDPDGNRIEAVCHRA